MKVFILATSMKIIFPQYSLNCLRINFFYVNDFLILEPVLKHFLVIFNLLRIHLSSYAVVNIFLVLFLTLLLSLFSYLYLLTIC